MRTIKRQITVKKQKPKTIEFKKYYQKSIIEIKNHLKPIILMNIGIRMFFDINAFSPSSTWFFLKSWNKNSRQNEKVIWKQCKREKVKLCRELKCWLCWHFFSKSGQDNDFCGERWAEGWRAKGYCG